jgi:hypothetical protein
MSRLVISTAMTVDGVVSVGEWYVSEGGHDRASRDQFVDAAGMLLGRKTYEGLAAFWSPMTGEWANVLNPMPTFVASRTLQEALDWNSTLIEGDLAEGVSRLKEERRRPGPDRVRRARALSGRSRPQRRAEVLGPSRAVGSRRAAVSVGGADPTAARRVGGIRLGRCASALRAGELGIR